MRQILARSKHTLMMSQDKWRHRINILFRHYPILKSGYHLAMEPRSIFNARISPTKAMGRMNRQYDKVMMKNWIRPSCFICFITTNYSKPSCLIEIQGRCVLLIHNNKPPPESLLVSFRRAVRLWRGGMCTSVDVAHTIIC